jgi:nucleotide-binding universal stress UspA family protein
MIGRIIVPVSGTRQLENKLNHAIALAGRFGSRVDVLFLHGEVDPQSIEYSPVFGTGWEPAEIRWAEEGPALSNVRTRLDRWLKTRAGTRDGGTVTGSRTNVTFLEIRGDYTQGLHDHGRTSDLIVIGQPGRGMAPLEVEINKLSVVESGRMVLVTPNESPPAENILTHALVAWDGGPQASTMVGLAMPILGTAQRATVYTSGNPVAFESKHALVRDYLECNGVTAEFVIDDNPPWRIGRKLLDTAKSRDVSLICMGAYERWRTAELIIGGNTRYVYSQSRLPVLLCA